MGSSNVCSPEPNKRLPLPEEGVSKVRVPFKVFDPCDASKNPWAMFCPVLLRRERLTGGVMAVSLCNEISTTSGDEIGVFSLGEIISKLLGAVLVRSSCWPGMEVCSSLFGLVVEICSPQDVARRKMARPPMMYFFIGMIDR